MEASLAFDDELAERVRNVLGDEAAVEKRMFGGLAFMVGGHMACGIVGDQLMVRLGVEGVEQALTEPYVRPMDFTGRPLHSMAFVAAEGVRDDDALSAWVRRTLAFVATLPPKP
jgi:hypothetical protein